MMVHDLVGHSEEVRTVDLVHLDAGRYASGLRHVLFDFKAVANQLNHLAPINPDIAALSRKRD